MFVTRPRNKKCGVSKTVFVAVHRQMEFGSLLSQKSVLKMHLICNYLWRTRPTLNSKIDLHSEAFASGYPDFELVLQQKAG